jgi:cytochrome c-type biogenesis protein CcmH/NrfG
MKRVLVSLLTLALCVAPRAYADTEPAAEALFEAGRTLMKGGDVEQACAKFRESHRLEPAPGTRLNLALCEESLGNLARAWQLFRSLATWLPPEDARLLLVREHLAELDQRVPRLVLHAEPDLPSGATVHSEGLSVTREGFDVPIPVDPGRYVLWVDAPEHARRAYEVELREYDSVELALSPGAPSLPAAAVRSIEAKPAADARAPAPSTVEHARKSDAAVLKTAGRLTLASGAAAIIASAALGYVAIQHAHAVETLCHPDGSCTPAGSAAARSGDAVAQAATVAFAVGVTLAGTGVTFLLVAGAPRTSAPSQAANARGIIGLSVGGTY